MLVPVIALLVVLVLGVLGVGAFVLLMRHRAATGTVDPLLLFSEADAFPGPRARAWAYGVLFSAGVDADADPLYAAEVLCNAEPRLHRRDAHTLIGVLTGPL